MTEEGIWIPDPITEEPTFIPYAELEEEARFALFKPVGGFCYPASQFIHLDLPEVPFYVQDWLPQKGKGMLYAPAKSGKSYLSLQLARSIGLGAPFLDLPTTQGTVLLIQFEMGAGVLQKRMRDTGQEYTNVYVGTTFSLKIDEQSGLDALCRAVEATEPNVLILDPLYKMIAGDENDTQDMRQVVDNLDRIIGAFGCSVFLIHHSGKDLSKGGRGASVLEDWVDSALEMRKVNSDGEDLKAKITPKLLRHAKNPPEPIKVEMVKYEFKLSAEATTVKDEISAFVHSRWLDAHQPATRANILSAGIGSNTSVQEALNQLCGEGKIERIGRGVYRWVVSEEVVSDLED